MNDDKAKAGDAETREDEAQRTAEDEHTGAPREEDLAAQLESARAEAESYRDRALRAQAETENVRKRAERDVESARKYGMEKFAKEMLGVRDSLEAGLASASESGTDLDKMREGMELTERMLAQAMEKFGVEQLDPAGETFDPEYHEAMSMQPSAEHAPNTVVNVVQKGYLLNGRVLRPAMVVVSSAPADDESSKEE